MIYDALSNNLNTLPIDKKESDDQLTSPNSKELIVVPSLSSKRRNMRKNLAP